MHKTAAAIVALLALAGPAAAVAQDNIWSDPAAIRRELLMRDEPMLAGMLDAYDLRDFEAAAALEAFLASESEDRAARGAAWGTLAMVQLRLGRYADAAGTLEAALAVFEGDDDARRGLEQTLGVAQALSGAEPQRRGDFEAGALTFERDLAGLPRVPLTINGQARTYVFDTGANFSVVTESQAVELGLLMLGQSAGIGSVTQDTTAAHLALAETLTIGNLTFENVIFLVMPDSSLSFAGGAYTIPGILGFPVISQMERISVAETTLSWGPSQGPVIERDLFVDGLTPRVYGHIGDGPAVQFALDTGANRTGLRPVVLIEQPVLAEGARDRTEQVGGAGGVVEVEARQIPRVTLRFDTVSVELENVSVADESAGGDDIHGRLGQDVLRRGYVLDFPAGDFGLMAED
jgi:predicted aspartyl protease